MPSFLSIELNSLPTVAPGGGIIGGIIIPGGIIPCGAKGPPGQPGGGCCMLVLVNDVQENLEQRTIFDAFKLCSNIVKIVPLVERNLFFSQIIAQTITSKNEICTS
jgi:hypothetical protein